MALRKVARAKNVLVTASNDGMLDLMFAAADSGSQSYRRIQSMIEFKP